jgi:hypothetical protein
MWPLGHCTCPLLPLLIQMGLQGLASGTPMLMWSILYTPPGVPHGFRTDHAESAESARNLNLPVNVHTDSVSVRAESVLVCADSVLVCADSVPSLQVNFRANST